MVAALAGGLLDGRRGGAGEGAGRRARGGGESAAGLGGRGGENSSEHFGGGVWVYVMGCPVVCRCGGRL